jgi:hypothetical protein
MEQNEEYLRSKMKENRILLAPLFRYLPWLEEASKKTVVNTYSGDGLGHRSVAFPVYDSTLMSFIREAEKSPILDRNYPYVYTRKGLKNHEQERALIERADWRNWDDLRGILSKYVMGGRTRSSLWSEGVSEQIFYLTLKQFQSIVDFWDHPERK